MTTITRRPEKVAATGTLRAGSALMALAGLAFIGYAVIFFVRNFTGAFLELGIGPGQVDVGRAEIREFSLPLYHYIAHLHIAVSGFIAATGLATAALVLGLAVALPAHYPYHLDTLGHLGLIYLATAVFVVGAILALKPILKSRHTTDL